MKEVIKICKKHGELKKEDQVRREKKQIRCRQCCLDRDRRWKSANREQHIACSVRYKKENRDKVNVWTRKDRRENPEKYRKWSKDLKDRNREKVRLQEICRNRGIKVEDYIRMFEDQNGLCMICKKPETRKSSNGDRFTNLCIDHCHETNKVRSLLCHGCNTAIGKMKDSIELLQIAIEYLQYHKQKAA